MTYQMPSQPIPEKPVSPPRNGFGIAGLVLGLASLVIMFVPIVSVIAWPLVIVAIVFATAGYLRARNGTVGNERLSLAGLVVSAVGLVTCISWLGFGAPANTVKEQDTTHQQDTRQRDGHPKIANLPNGDQQADNQQTSTQQTSQHSIQQDGPMHTVTYQATGNSPGATINYTTYTNGKMSTVRDQPVNLPWAKEIQTRADVSDAFLVVLTGPGGGTVSCVVVVDGQQTKQATASGTAATAAC